MVCLQDYHHLHAGIAKGTISLNQTSSKASIGLHLTPHSRTAMALI